MKPHFSSALISYMGEGAADLLWQPAISMHRPINATNWNALFISFTFRRSLDPLGEIITYRFCRDRIRFA